MSVLRRHRGWTTRPRSQATDHLLRRLAEAGARVRAEIDASAEVLATLASDGFRPRAIVAAGRDARLVRAVLEPVCPVPFVAWPGPGLPGWAGPLDLVVVLAGTSEDLGAISAAAEAVRRGCGLMVASPEDSPVATRPRPARGTRSGCRPSPTTSWRPRSPYCRRCTSWTLGPEVDAQGRRGDARRRRDRVLAQQRRRVEPGQGPRADARRRVAAGVGWLGARRPGSATCGRGIAAGQWSPRARRRRRSPAAGAANQPPRDLFADPFDKAEELRPGLVILDDGVEDPGVAETGASWRRRRERARRPRARGDPGRTARTSPGTPP